MAAAAIAMGLLLLQTATVAGAQDAARDRARAAARDAAGAAPPKPAPKPPQSGQAASGVTDQGITGPLHAANVGKIVFTRANLGMNDISASSLATTFVAGEPLFFRVYMAESSVNHLIHKRGAPSSLYADGMLYKARFTVNGQVIETRMFPWGSGENHRSWTTWRGQLVNPSVYAEQRVPGSEVWFELLARATARGLLGTGKYKVQMDLIPFLVDGDDKPTFEGDVVASGVFELTMPANAFNPTNAGMCGLQKGAISNADTEATALAIARKRWDWAGFTPVKAVGVGGAWTVLRNELTSVPIERTGDVAIFARGADYCMSLTHRFTEPYIGDRFSASSGALAINFDKAYVPCGCLK